MVLAMVVADQVFRARMHTETVIVACRKGTEIELRTPPFDEAGISVQLREALGKQFRVSGRKDVIRILFDGGGKV